MRFKIVCFIWCILITQLVAAQEVGIGISTPTEKLQVDSGSVKIGQLVWNPAILYFLKFGDGDFVTIGENTLDDVMELKARNFIILPSDGTYSGNVGIGTTNTNDAKLSINGVIKIDDGNASLGRVLTSINSAGVANWDVPPMSKYLCRMTSASNVSLADATYTLLPLNSVNYNFGGFTNNPGIDIPVDGMYHIDVNVNLNITTNVSDVLNRFFLLRVKVNNIGIRDVYLARQPGVIYGTLNFSGDYVLSAADNVSIDIFQNTGTVQIAKDIAVNIHRIR